MHPTSIGREGITVLWEMSFIVWETVEFWNPEMDTMSPATAFTISIWLLPYLSLNFEPPDDLQHLGLLNGVALLIHGDCLVVYLDFARVNPPDHHFAEIGVAFSLADEHLERLLDVHRGRTLLMSYGTCFIMPSRMQLMFSFSSLMS